MFVGEGKSHLDVLQNIEVGLVAAYRSDLELTDSRVVLALGKAKAAIKQRFGFGFGDGKGLRSEPDTPSEGSIFARVVTIGMERIGTGERMPLDAYVRCIDQVARSVERHRAFGVRGYFAFITNCVV